MKGAFYEMVQHTGKNANVIISKANMSYLANNTANQGSKLI